MTWKNKELDDVRNHLNWKHIGNEFWMRNAKQLKTGKWLSIHRDHLNSPSQAACQLCFGEATTFIRKFNKKILRTN